MSTLGGLSEAPRVQWRASSEAARVQWRAGAPEFDEVGELTGLSLAFETQVVGVRVLGGEVRVVALAR